MPRSTHFVSTDASAHAIRRARLGVWDWNLLTDICHYSDSWFEMLGYEPGELDATSDLWIRLTHPDDVERAITSGERHLEGQTDEIETELRLRHKSGRWIWVLDRGGIVERDAAGKPVRVVGVQTDITPQKETENELQAVNERVRLALEASDIGIWQFDFDTKKSYWDSRTRQIFGLPPGDGEIGGEAWHRGLHPDERAMVQRAHLAIGPETTRLHYRIVRPDGTVRHVETLARLLRVDGSAGRQTGTIRDVTDEHLQREQLQWAARHDAMTGLLNRSAFEEELAGRIQNAIAAPFWLVYIDLDHFKAVNDTAGHAAGDAVLRKVAEGLARLAGPIPTARLGGDEFALLLGADQGDPQALADSILALMSDNDSNPDFQTMLGASIGLAEIDSPDVSVEDALARADDACYSAKAAGRNQWSAFAKSGPTASGLTAARLVADVADAKRDGRLKLYGQKVFDLRHASREASHIEVLARLQSRHGPFIPPVEFITAAERFGAASALDRWILQTALHQFGRSTGTASLAINFSAQTLSDPGLWDFVEASVDEAGVDRTRLWFELTETAAITNRGVAQRFMRTARDAGYRIALDDFGVGLSSFAYLREFEVDAIKVDGSFVQRVALDSIDREIVSSVQRIASTVGCELIAEKIEDEATLNVLKDLGVHFGQGYLMHRPEPLAGLLDARSRRRA